jgi:hypothetical protein
VETVLITSRSLLDKQPADNVDVMQIIYKLLALPTSCIWHLVAAAREYNHRDDKPMYAYHPRYDVPSHLYDDRMMGMGMGKEDWVPLDLEVFEVACRMERVGQRMYQLAEVGRALVLIGAAGEEKESPFIVRDPVRVIAVTGEQAGGKRKRETSEPDTSMRITRNRSGKQQQQHEGVEYAIGSDPGESDPGEDPLVIEQCEVRRTIIFCRLRSCRLES